MLRRIWPLLLTLVAPSACSRSAEMPPQQADGSYRLTCTGPLTDCLERAERICKDEGYTVMGHDVHELLGHESGQSQVEVRKSEATIVCGKPQGAGARTFVELKRDPVTASPAPAKAVPLACVPGSTQACVGPGGCKGGQACASDGSRYESCDCSGQPSATPDAP